MIILVAIVFGNLSTGGREGDDRGTAGCDARHHQVHLGSDGRPLRNTEVKILDEVDFDVVPGEVHVLVGKMAPARAL